MRILDRLITLQGRGDVVSIYPIGDTHFGAKNCAKRPLKRIVNEIKDNPLAYWFGGGDIINAIKPQDSKRHDINSLPDEMFTGTPEEIKRRLSDVTNSEADEAIECFMPIRDKCLFFLEGNHASGVRKRYNHDVHTTMCEKLGVIDGYAATWLRLRFILDRNMITLKLGARHGYGGGRSPGAEPRKLADLLSSWYDCDLVFSGHTHCAETPAPQARLYLPNRGELPKELLVRYGYAANWGSWLYTHAAGKSTYEEEACYPPRPLITVKADIKPFHHTDRLGKDLAMPKIEIRTITL